MHGTIAVGDLCLCQGGGCVEAEKASYQIFRQGGGAQGCRHNCTPPPHWRQRGWRGEGSTEPAEPHNCRPSYGPQLGQITL
jgi:hypothetical protein